MLYFDNGEEQAARVEMMLEELHRGSAAPKPAPFVLLTRPPATALPLTAKPKLRLVAKSK
jgi:hypothetical protein